MWNKPLVSIKDLQVFFPSKKKKKNLVEVIRKVDLKIFPKEIVGFIGESGSGKSVTAKTLIGSNFNAASKAFEFRIGDVNLLDKNQNFNTKNSFLRQVRGKLVAYIPQDSLSSLNPTMKIGRQIVESIKLHNKKKFKTSEEQKAYAIELLKEFGIQNAEKRFNNFPHEFSGGMRQRVMIAMVVACNPKLIIADEPTTALDPTIQASVLALFKKVVKKFNCSIVFISHDISVVANFCDYINIFYAGKIVEKGSREQIFSNPQHPYTWALLSSIPDATNKNSELFSIEGQPPSFENLPFGDPFSVRNPFALKIDFQKEPPLFKVAKGHYAATWLLHENAPKVKIPEPVQKIISITKKISKGQKKQNEK